jgi:hypothetical protein
MSVDVINYIDEHFKPPQKPKSDFDWRSVVVYTDHIQDVARRYNIAAPSHKVPKKWRDIFAKAGITDKELALTSALIVDLERWSPLINLDEIDRLHKLLPRQEAQRRASLASINTPSSDTMADAAAPNQSPTDLNTEYVSCCTQILVLGLVIWLLTQSCISATRRGVLASGPYTARTSDGDAKDQPHLHTDSSSSPPRQDTGSNANGSMTAFAAEPTLAIEAASFEPIDPAAMIRKAIIAGFNGSSVDLKLEDPRPHYRVLQPIEFVILCSCHRHSGYATINDYVYHT